MAFDLMKKIKQLCKGCIDDDEICIFLVAAILGFLLCIFLKNNEPFTDFAPFNEEDGGNEELVGKSEDSDPVLGLKTIQRNPENVPPSLQKDFQTLQQNSQKYTAQNIQNKQGLNQMNNAQFQPFQGWDFHGYAPVDLKLDVKPQVPSNKGPMGPDRPMTGDLAIKVMPDGKRVMAPQQAFEKDSMLERQTGMDLDGDGRVLPPVVPLKAHEKDYARKRDQELKIVLIYATWCGHSKKMLHDFAKIESEYHNKTINGTLVLIEKHTDENKELVKEYGVKGFPTLFSVKNGNRSPLNERSYEGLKNHIENNV